MWLGADWDAPHRVDRITKLLDQRRGHTLDSQREIQTDVRSAWAELLLPRMLELLPSQAASRPRAQLAAWRYELTADAVEPLLFQTWLRELTRAIFADELGQDFEALWGELPNLLPDVLFDRAGRSHWCDQRATPDREPCAEIVAQAWQRAVTQLEATGPRAARWGDVHHAHFEHTPLGSIPLLSPVFNVALPVAGGGDTVNLAQSDLGDGDAPFSGRWGPSYRAIYDLADPEASRFVVAPGQSGNRLSPHYDDLAERWARGRADPDADASRPPEIATRSRP